jgi:hypothetical protein
VLALSTLPCWWTARNALREITQLNAKAIIRSTVMMVESSGTTTHPGQRRWSSLRGHVDSHSLTSRWLGAGSIGRPLSESVDPEWGNIGQAFRLEAITWAVLRPDDDH